MGEGTQKSGRALGIQEFVSLSVELLSAPSRLAAAVICAAYCPSTHAKSKGAQIVASLSITNFGVEAASLPQVIFSFGTAPE